MTSRIFKARHWQVFVTFLFISFLQGLSEGFYGPFDAIFYSAYVTVYVGWLLFLGSKLREISPRPAMNYQLFMVTGIVLIVVAVTFRFLTVFEYGVFKESEMMTIVMMMLAYIFTSLVILTSFIGKHLKLIEVGADIDINDYFNDIFGLIFWPIGIWTFQPRLNRLADQQASR